MNIGKRVYWDANVFHALFGQEAGRVEGCRDIEASAKQGEVEIYTSAITFVECIWIKGKPDKFSEEHEEVLSAWFLHKFLRIVQCDRLIAESARQLIWKNPHLKPKDAIHVASALFSRVDVMHTYDNDDLVVLNRKIGSPPLRIENPPPPEPRLFPSS
jgi:predicted nucleic acid-binding protein